MYNFNLLFVPPSHFDKMFLNTPLVTNKQKKIT